MNKVVLIGRLTKDPDLRYTSSNIPAASFTVAVNRPFQNQNGVREADFINVVVWRKQAENVKKYIVKGSLVAVEGRIQTRNYEDKDGKKV
jgi:single-strand DNA-binding protein